MFLHVIIYNMDKKKTKPRIITIKNPRNGISYLYSDQHYWDTEKQQTRHDRVCIGKIDRVTGKPIYNQRYLAARKSDGTMDEAPISTQIGPELVLKRLSKELGLGRTLKRIFNETHVPAILALAWYQVCMHTPLSYAPQWLSQRGMGKSIRDCSDIAKLLDEMDEERIRGFLDRWDAQAASGTAPLFIVAPSFCTDRNNRFLDYGSNHDHEAMDANSLSILIDSQGIPRDFVRTGSRLQAISDLEDRLRMMERNRNPTLLVLGRNSYDHSLLQPMEEEGIGFLVRLPLRSKAGRELLTTYRKELLEAETFEDSDGFPLRSVSIEAGGTTMHLYYDETWRNQQERNLFHLLASCKDELTRGRMTEEHQRLYSEYFEVKRSGQKKRIVLKKDPAERFASSLAGFWTIRSNLERDGRKAVDIYETGNRIERFFEDIQNETDCRHLDAHVMQRKDALVFLKFIALILQSRFSQRIRPLYGSEHMRAIMELDGISRALYPTEGVVVMSRRTERQRRIADILAIGDENGRQ
jgi:hypothetical protein